MIEILALLFSFVFLWILFKYLDKPQYLKESSPQRTRYYIQTSPQDARAPVGFLLMSKLSPSRNPWLSRSHWLEVPRTPTPLSRIVYQELYAVIGDTWGAGDGRTTFGENLYLLYTTLA